MGADLASENNPGNDRDDGDWANLGIPLPRPAADDDMSGLPVIDSGDPVWRYDQPRSRGRNNRHYFGHVDRIGGREGDRLRGNFAAIVRDLLDWAKRHTETESREDGGDNDTSS
jgi:hypothetical protein